MTSHRLIAFRRVRNELLILLAFIALTVVMTWPWAVHIRDAVTIPGDSYLNAWTLWWDYHQTFTDPLHLFEANIFFPYHHTLAFSENQYGIALLFFPLFALGLRPLTVHGIALLFGFASSGYGAFRLTRTLTGSNGAAWVAGVCFAFIPYRFHQIDHLPYLFTGWIPIVFEALVLFARQRRWRRAVWLGLALLMNGLSCIHWLVLIIIPLAFAAAFLVFRYRIGWEKAFWTRAGCAIAVALLVLLPFLIPYLQAAKQYGFVRHEEVAAEWSARPIHWLSADWHNKNWIGLGTSSDRGERTLFPGLVPILLGLAAFFLVEPINNRPEQNASRARRAVLILLDGVAIIAAIFAALAMGYGTFRFRVFGLQILQITDLTITLTIFIIAVLVRYSLAFPQALSRAKRTSAIEIVRSDQRSTAFILGGCWVVIGFLGSFGMNFIFHRALFQFVPIFRSIRVPARWAMICYVGLAVLAGVGAKHCAMFVARRRLALKPYVVYLVIVLVMLFEQRAAPLNLVHGAVDPDQLTLRLKETPMSGGIVEIPVDEFSKYRYTLRAADHARPLVTAVSGFPSPIVEEIKFLLNEHPIPDRLLDVLESTPASYLVVHHAYLAPAVSQELEPFLARAVTSGRLQLVQSYGEGPTRDDLFLVTKTEQTQKSEPPR